MAKLESDIFPGLSWDRHRGEKDTAYSLKVLVWKIMFRGSKLKYIHTHTLGWNENALCSQSNPFSISL